MTKLGYNNLTRALPNQESHLYKDRVSAQTSRENVVLWTDEGDGPIWAVADLTEPRRRLLLSCHLSHVLISPSNNYGGHKHVRPFYDVDCHGPKKPHPHVRDVAHHGPIACHQQLLFSFDFLIFFIFDFFKNFLLISCNITSSSGLQLYVPDYYYF